MSPTNLKSRLFALPPELRRSIYDMLDVEALGRGEQVCKQLRDEINPHVEKIGQEQCSPWSTLRKQEFPKFDMSTLKKPHSAKSLYQGAKLESRKRSVPLLDKVLKVVVKEKHLGHMEALMAWHRITADVRKPKP